MARAGLRLQNSCLPWACARECRSCSGGAGIVLPLRPGLIRSRPCVLWGCSPGAGIERLLTVSVALLECCRRRSLGQGVRRTVVWPRSCQARSTHIRSWLLLGMAMGLVWRDQKALPQRQVGVPGPQWWPAMACVLLQALWLRRLWMQLDSLYGKADASTHSYDC